MFLRNLYVRNVFSPFFVAVNVQVDDVDTPYLVISGPGGWQQGADGGGHGEKLSAAGND
jgi:hypothetical protein